MGRSGRSDMMMNALRSGVVVLGALGFGYLSLQIGFKPYLEKAQLENAIQQSETESSPSSQEPLSFPERDS
ncbi:uncharacterized protein LOC130722994 [Lotus japonicus]|uniref:uncharacterized protein LOC130722994 n=1 Tax=Lotus japonicus TaxID=34305 RepID=UPI0025867C05|nr:uncharacterized protein LOC130722994 [Lotus japonicus]